MVADILKDLFSSIITNLNSPPYIDLLRNTENVEDTVLIAKGNSQIIQALKLSKIDFLIMFSFNKVTQLGPIRTTMGLLLSLQPF